MNILALIPARMGSSRFPGKPLAPILGKPMIDHVYSNVRKCSLLTSVIVATCDTEIYDYIKSIDGEAIMTKNTHERASDRCAEALLKIEEINNLKYDIVVMVQGDEPMVNKEMLTEAITPMINDNTIEVLNLLGDINSINEFHDENCIKVVCDSNNNALFFSRQPIPTCPKNINDKMKKQVCIIPFKRDFLIEYTKLSPTPYEELESIDMLRVLENGKSVKMVPTQHESFAVDTPTDLVKVEKLMKNKFNSNI